MISIVIPTRNRAYTLEKVLHSYYIQKHVSQIIVVNDDSEDNTPELVDRFAKDYPHVETVLISNHKRHGASYCRNRGVQAARNEYILFGEDDAFLSENYSTTLLSKLSESPPDVGIVSGRLIILSPKEDPIQSIQRFGNGDPKQKKTFRYYACSHIPNAYFVEDVQLPLTHALILTRKDLLQKFPFDTFYSKGNAYREESDFQMHAFTNGVNILVTNETHCMHLHSCDVKSGGQRTSYVKNLWYKIYYTNYFYKKYYNKFKDKCGLKLPAFCALFLFTADQSKEFFFSAARFMRKKVRSRFLTRKV